MRTSEICLSYWHRDPGSPSFGCFDRQYWGWKKKDFPDAALQAAVMLCVRFAEHRGETKSLSALLDGYVSFLESIQHRDGSFDQFYPNERAPGVVYDLLSSLLWLRRSPHLDDVGRSRLEAVVRRATAYAISADETHGEIANHFSYFAWELLNVGRELALPEATRKGREYLERTLALLHPTEGWFREYDGADAGYQTRLLAFLTRTAALLEDDELWEVCRRGARFVELMLMPDDSLHPMLGVRSTALIYPSAFERLAARFPEMAPLADRIHRSWARGRVPLPSLIDVENGIRLAEDAFDAAALRDQRVAADPSPAASFEPFDLIDAGLHRRRCPAGVLHVGSRLGGVVVLYAGQADGEWKIVHEDAGYLLELPNENSRWLTRHANAARIIEQEDRRIVIETEFQRSLHDEMTPLRMIVLRLLNLTILRWQWIGDLFRKLVVRRLIAGRQSLPVRLRREIVVTDDGVEVTDRITSDASLVTRLAGARLYRCRRITGNHMASSRYFQTQELAVGDSWIQEIPIQALDGRPLVIWAVSAANGHGPVG